MSVDLPNERLSIPIGASAPGGSTIIRPVTFLIGNESARKQLDIATATAELVALGTKYSLEARGALDTFVGDVYVKGSRGRLRHEDVTVPFDTGDELLVGGQALKLKHPQESELIIEGLSREVSLNGALRSRSIWSAIPVDVRTVFITLVVSNVIPFLWRMRRRRYRGESGGV